MLSPFFHLPVFSTSKPSSKKIPTQHNVPLTSHCWSRPSQSEDIKRLLQTQTQTSNRHKSLFPDATGPFASRAFLFSEISRDTALGVLLERDVSCYGVCATCVVTVAERRSAVILSSLRQPLTSGTDYSCFEQPCIYNI